MKEMTREQLIAQIDLLEVQNRELKEIEAQHIKMETDLRACELELEVQERPIPLKQKLELQNISKAHDSLTSIRRTSLELKQQLEYQDILLKISKQFTSSVAENIDDMISVALQEIGIFNGADRCHLVLFSEDGAKIDAAHEWCAEGITPLVHSFQNVATDFLPWLRQQLFRSEVVRIANIDDLPSEAQTEKEFMRLNATQSLILVPVTHRTCLVGALGIDSTTLKIAKTNENVTILELVAQTFANALQRKKYIETIRESENYYRTIFENTGSATMIIEEDMTISMVNPGWENLFGYKKDEIEGSLWTEIVSEDMLETMKGYHRIRRIYPAAVPLKYQTRILDRQGTYRDGTVAVGIISGTKKSVATFIDFTRYNRVARSFKSISAVNATMIQAEKEEDLLQNVCQKIVEVGGYGLVWVAYLKADQQQTVQPVACAGRENGYLAKLNITLTDPQRGQGPVATAIRTGQPVVSRDLEKDPTFKPWLKDALLLGYTSCMAIPLIADNKALGALSIYSSENDRFDRAEEQLLIQMANNLRYAIISIRTRAQHHLTEDELEKSLEKMQRILMQAVTSLGTALNRRDPYTAGHQKNVAQLAIAIGEEMCLSKAQIEGIEVTGNLHDLGKISVPSEMLNKPGKLSDLEFALIKAHSQAGYEIVKDIEFPWPVAEVILQHHERMNGSGYPRGLAREDILPEARIMAVADTVEAMVSHRPYRPALGIDKALEEIIQNKGILYDADVVDVCLKLFREKDFEFE